MESGSCLHPGREAVGGNRLISTPSGTFPAWLGVTSDKPGDSPNLIPATPPVSGQGLDLGTRPVQSTALPHLRGPLV